MFKDLSVQTRNFLASLTEFTSVMQREIDGESKLLLFPIVASLGTPFPFATYVLSEKTPQTKDSGQIIITLDFWFSIEQYDQCCEFTDAIEEKIDEKFLFLSSSIEYNEETETFSGVINFNII